MNANGIIDTLFGFSKFSAFHLKQERTVDKTVHLRKIKYGLINLKIILLF